MAKVSFEIDAGDFLKGMRKYIAIMPQRFERGMAAMAKQLLEDANNIPPRTPVLTGRLSQSGAAFVGLKRMYTTNRGKGTPATRPYSYVTAPRFKPRGEVSFSTPYAAKQHRDHATGKEYLRKKVRMFRSKYMRILADNIKHRR